MTNNKHFDEIGINIEELSENSHGVVAEPFDRGYGVTIGNCLRRTLLTSIPGAAITQLGLKALHMNLQLLMEY